MRGVHKPREGQQPTQLNVKETGFSRFIRIFGFKGKDVKPVAPQVSVKNSPSHEPSQNSPTDLQERTAQPREPATPKLSPKKRGFGIFGYWGSKDKKLASKSVPESSQTPVNTPPRSPVSPVLPFVPRQDIPKIVIDDAADSDVATRGSSASDISDDDSVNTYDVDFSDFGSDVDIEDALDHLDLGHSPHLSKNLKAKRNFAEKAIGWVIEKKLGKHLPVDNEETNRLKEQIEEIDAKIKQTDGDQKDHAKLHKHHEKLRKNREKALAGHRDKLLETQEKLAKARLQLRKAELKGSDSRSTIKTRAEFQKLTNRHTDLIGHIQDVEGDIRKIDGILENDELVTDARGSTHALLEIEKKSLMDELAVAQNRVKQFNRQLVSLVLNLRRLHKGKAVLPPLHMPKMKIPAGDDFLELSHVTFNPAGITTRMENGQPIVDIELTDIEASVLAPIEGGVKADVRLQVSPIKLTLGGPVAKAFQDYLDCNKKQLVLAMLHLGKVFKQFANGKLEGAPVQVNAEIGTVRVDTNDTNSDVVVRAVSIDRRNPDSSLNTLLEQVKMPVNVAVGQVDVHTHGEVDVAVAARGLEVKVDPEMKGSVNTENRMAALKVKARSIQVDASGPVVLAGKTVSQLLPPDPLHIIDKTVAPRSILEKLPADTCHAVSGSVDDLELSLEQNLNKHTTRLSPDKKVWRVEGDSSARLDAGRVTVKAMGNLEVQGSVNNLHVRKTQVGADQDDLEVTVGEENLGICGYASVNCKPGFVKNLAVALKKDPAEATAEEKKGLLDNLLIDGSAAVQLAGRAKIAKDSKTGETKAEFSAIQADATNPVMVMTEDVRLRLPKTVKGHIRDVQVSSTPVKHRDLKQKRTTVNLGTVDMEGSGKIIVETGLEEGVRPRHHFSFPLQGKAHLSGMKVVSTEMPDVDKGRKTKRSVLRPDNLRLNLDNIDSGRMHVGVVGLTLDKNLNGNLKIQDAAIGFNDLVNDQVAVDTDKMKAEERGNGSVSPVQVRDALPMPRIVKKLLRNKILTVSGDIPVEQGAMHLRKLRQLKVRVKADPRTGVMNRMVSSVLNAGVKVVVYFLSDRALSVNNEGGSPVVRSPLLGHARIPLPPKFQEGLVANDSGALDIAAMQSQVTGLYCFPQAKQQELDALLDNVYKRGDSVTALDKLLKHVEGTISDKARRQEGLYLLNGLHVDGLVRQAQESGNEAMKSQLRRAAASALKHPATQGLALYIYNAGFAVLAPVSEAQLAAFEACAEPSGHQAMNLAEILWKSGQAGRAAPVLTKMVEKDKNTEARLLLAQYHWGSDEPEAALEHLKEAAKAGGSEGTGKVLKLLDKYAAEVEGDDAMISHIRLLQGALALRTETHGGDSAGFLAGVDRLEELAVKDLHVGKEATKVLQERCAGAHLVHEDLNLDEWEFWNHKMDKAVKSLREGKPVELLPEERYQGGLSLMYCFNGINQNLPAAQALFESVQPQTPAIQLHLSILESVLAQQAQGRQAAA